MRKFQYEVKESMFPCALDGEIEAKSKASAYDELSDWYAMELGTTPEELEITIWEVA